MSGHDGINDIRTGSLHTLTAQERLALLEDVERQIAEIDAGEEQDQAAEDDAG